MPRDSSGPRGSSPSRPGRTSSFQRSSCRSSAAWPTRSPRGPMSTTSWGIVTSNDRREWESSGLRLEAGPDPRRGRQPQASLGRADGPREAQRSRGAESDGSAAPTCAIADHPGLPARGAHPEPESTEFLVPDGQLAAFGRRDRVHGSLRELRHSLLSPRLVRTWCAPRSEFRRTPTYPRAANSAESARTNAHRRIPA